MGRSRVGCCCGVGGGMWVLTGRVCWEKRRYVREEEGGRGGEGGEVVIG